MADAGTVIQHDFPGGVVRPEAHAIKWLQDALDYFAHRFPWASMVTSTTLTLTTASEEFSLPSDFVLDVKDGLVIPASIGGPGRCWRRPLQDLISLGIDATPGVPVVYTIHDPYLRVYPKPNKAYASTFWYYKLPALLDATTKPTFPDDWTLIEYVRLRALEWIRVIPAGSAQQYAEMQCVKLQKTGMGREPEYDTIQLDNRRFRPGGMNRADWMGGF